MQRYGGGSLLATFTLAYARRLFKCLYDQVVAKAQLHRIVRAHPHKNLIVILFIEIFFITLFTILLFLSISTLIIFFYTSLSYISLCFVQVLYKYNFSFNVLPSMSKRTRKATQLRSLSARPMGLERPLVHVDPNTGKVVGPYRKKLRTYLGVIA